MGTFEIHQRKNGNYYWMLKASGQIIAESYHDYVSESALHNAIASVIKHTQDAQVVDLTKTERSYDKTTPVKMPPQERQKIWDVDEWEKDWQNRRNEK